MFGAHPFAHLFLIGGFTYAFFVSSQIWEEGSSWRWGTHYQGLGFLHFQINELGIGEVNLIRMEPRLIFFFFSMFP